MREGWEIKKLGEVCSIQMGQSPTSDTYNDKADGLPFFQGNADFGLVYPTIRVYCNYPIRIADVNDILISVRAPIGAINIANVQCCIGRGLASIKNKDKVMQSYVYHALVANREKLISQGTGSTFKSIGKIALNDLLIPIPPLSEQEKIVVELDCLSGIIEKKKQQLKELDYLAQSIFYEMFGDPVENEKGWEVKKLGEIGELARGVSKHRPRNAPELLGGNIPLIQTGDISNANMYLKDYNYTYSELGLSQSRLWPSGTLCITIAATIGKCSILTFDSCFPDSIVGYIVNYNYTNNEYVYYIFGFLQKILEENAPAVAQKNINLKILNDLLIPLPPLSLQQQFANKIELIEKQKELIKQSIKETETLFDSRMDYYFNS
jgi:type I restriction enzyme S subunit